MFINFSLFSKKTPIEPHAAGPNKDNYPPPMTGIRPRPSAELVNDQEELITRIQQFNEIPKEEFNRIVLPVIHKFASFVHLLPASENHHHNKIGGLLHHSLEVGLFSLQKAKGHEFCSRELPEIKNSAQPKWRLAAFLAGMLHDIGKPYIDYSVTNQDGDRWNPNTMGLETWFKSNNVKEYFIEWKKDRKKLHEKWTSLGLVQIITNDIQDFLGVEIFNELYESIVDEELVRGRLSEMIIYADQRSVNNDMALERVTPLKYSYTITAEKYLLSALRRMVKIDLINEKRALFWVLESGLYVSWESAVKEAMDMIHRDEIKGINGDPSYLANILLERGLAEYLPDEGESGRRMFWHIYPEALDNGLKCLKFASIKTLFSNEPPPTVNATVLRADGSAYEDTLYGQALKNATPEFEESTAETESEIVSDESDYKQTESSEQQYQAVHSWDEVDKEAGKITQIEAREEIPEKEIIHTQSQNISKMQTMAKQLDKSDEEKKPPVRQKKNATKPDVKKETPVTQDYAQLPNTAAWKYIKKAIVTKNIIEKLSSSDIGILYPASAKILGEPAQVLNALFEEKLLKLDEVSGGKITHMLGKKYLILSDYAVKLIKLVPESSRLPQKRVAGKKAQAPTTKARRTKIKKTGDMPPDQVVTEFIQQLINGYGEYIGEYDITEKVEGDVKTYQITDTVLEHISIISGVKEGPLELYLQKLTSIKLDESNNVITYREKI